MLWLSLSRTLSFYLIRSSTYFEVAATKPKISKEEHRFILFRWIIWRNYYTAALMVMSQRSKVLFIKEEKNVCALQLGDHSTTTWAKSYPILTLNPHPPRVDENGHFTFHLLGHVTSRELSIDPHPPLFCPHSYWMTPWGTSFCSSSLRLLFMLHKGPSINDVTIFSEFITLLFLTTGHPLISDPERHLAVVGCS